MKKIRLLRQVRNELIKKQTYEDYNGKKLVKKERRK